LFFEKRLREKAGRRAIVLIGIVEPVRVELELAVVEVEVGRVREIAIGFRLICPCPSISLEVKKIFSSCILFGSSPSINSRHLPQTRASSISSRQLALENRSRQDSGCLISFY